MARAQSLYSSVLLLDAPLLMDLPSAPHCDSCNVPGTLPAFTHYLRSYPVDTSSRSEEQGPAYLTVLHSQDDCDGSARQLDFLGLLEDRQGVWPVKFLSCTARRKPASEGGC
ncbi:hypothetical protein DFP72DRAFT_906955 [Ephemerocybe angulata]|uniref:Uncharacterized protein n=1 Tax=Ephemerocybe angulata TaxID=980116 RepID=A0A8H6HR95_9AGAR|nr:hypothetical protein DFP72DRAFT_906955 [Tulosesus angulatus]